MIRALVRLPKAEFTVMGLKQLMSGNSEVVKDSFNAIDDKQIRDFIRENRYTLGMDDDGAISKNALKNWMSLWK